MTNVVGINGEVVHQVGEPNATLIEILEDLVVLAKEGRLQSFVGTGFVAGGERLTVWGPLHPNVYEMRGAIAWLESEYVDRVSGDV